MIPVNSDDDRGQEWTTALRNLNLVCEWHRPLGPGAGAAP